MKKLIEHYKKNLKALMAIAFSIVLGTAGVILDGPLGVIIFWYSLTPIILIGDWYTINKKTK